ncbi:MAG: N-acetyltransferase [Sphingobacteriaceae bacterium]|nr:MAG: N-acetyltransferase [Sphingobacteriaceae bacterium]
MKYEEIELVNNEAVHKFEIEVEGYHAFIDYLYKNDKYYLVHTQVPEQLEGKGVAGALVEKALTYIDAKNIKIVPLCSYIQGFIKHHPEWQRIVA